MAPLIEGCYHGEISTPAGGDICDAYNYSAGGTPSATTKTATDAQYSYVTTCNYLQRPHTLGTLFICLMLIWALLELPFFRLHIFSDTTKGTIAAVLMFLVFITVQGPDGLLVFPFKLFWRFVMGVSLLYLTLLIFLYFQDLNVIRQGLKYIDSELGVPLSERSYAENCNSRDTFYNQLDIFVPAHFFGWIIKMLIIRDVKIVWFLSCFYEWTEFSLKHILPNFRECWWDHLIFDIFGCNCAGIYIGVYICKRYNLKLFNWSGKNYSDDQNNIKINTLTTKANRMHGHIIQWIRRRVPYFFDFNSFYATFAVCLASTIADLNFFFLKTELWLSPAHWICMARLILIVFISVPALYEFYSYMIERNDQHRMGVQCWLTLGTVVMEMALIYRWRHGIPPHGPCPLWILVIWATGFLFLGIIAGHIWIFSSRDSKVLPTV